MSASGLTITIPPGCDIRLSIVAPRNLVLVAPPGVKAGATAIATVDHRAVLACRLDRNADALLFLGCHIAAERLAVRAQALREVGASA